MNRRGNIAKFIMKIVVVSLFIGLFFAGCFALCVGEIQFMEILPLCILAGLIMGVMFTIWRFTSGKIVEDSISFEGKEHFPSTLKATLEKMNYRLESEIDEVSEWKYIGGGWDQLLLENISVKLENNLAIIAGPKEVVKKLKETAAPETQDATSGPFSKLDEKKMYCPYCGKKDIEIPGKCPHCGKGIKEVDKESRYECEKCGKDVSADALYCWFCGNNVEEIVTDEQDATPGPFSKLDAKDTEKRVKRFEEIKEQYETFFGKGTADTNFLSELTNHLGDNERIVKAAKLIGKHTLSSYGGLLVTNESVILFDIGIANRFWVVKYGAGTSLEYCGLLKDKLKITDANAWIKVNLYQNIADIVPTIKYYLSKAQQEIPSGKFEREDEVEALALALHDENLFVRDAALRGFGNMGDSRAVDFIIQAINDESFEERDTALKVLEKFSSKEAVEPLIQALKHEDPQVRIKAAIALGNIGDKRALDALAQAAEEKNRGVRRHAEAALKKIRGK